MHNLYNYFEKLAKDNKLVQSYLIGNTKYDIIFDELNLVIDNFIFNNSSASNIDIKVLKADDGIISKEDIKSIIENVNKTSQFNGKKVYIIDECELLNDFSCNSLLKTLEEPQEGVYAFLITKNMEYVKKTIASRCQKIFISNNIEELEEDKYLKIADDLYNSLENNNLNTIIDKYYFYNEISDKKELLKILNIILKKYDKILNDNSLKKEKFEIVGKKILIINDIISMLEYSLNKNLCIDRLIIEIWRCNDENSRN